MLLIELGIVFWVGEEGVGGELGELTAPEVGAQAALGRHPLAVDRGQGLDGTGIFAADQHPIGLFEIADGGASARNSGLESTEKDLRAEGVSASAALRMVVITSVGLSMLLKALRSGPGALPPESADALEDLPHFGKELTAQAWLLGFVPAGRSIEIISGCLTESQHLAQSDCSMESSAASASRPRSPSARKLSSRWSISCRSASVSSGLFCSAAIESHRVWTSSNR